MQIYQKAADRGVDLPEDVADHVKSGHQGELQGVVHHHADKHDVSRVLVEQTVGSSTRSLLLIIDNYCN